MRWLVIASLCAACGSDGDAEEPDAAVGSVDAAPSFDVAATSGQIVRDYSLRVTGSGTRRVGRIDIGLNKGTIEIGGELYPAFSYVNTPVQAGFDIYQTLAVGSRGWFVAWFYCMQSELQAIYIEGTDGSDLLVEDASGDCNRSAGPQNVEVDIPAHSLSWPEVDQSFTVTGAEIDITEGAGTISVEGRAFDIAVFEGVDCSDGCATNGSWWELHSLLRDPLSGEVCFSIGYLNQASPGAIDFFYTMCLPTLAEPSPSLSASWSPPRARLVPRPVRLLPSDLSPAQRRR